jgi:arabinogalactan endo-1,4-beta-galactosidase
LEPLAKTLRDYVKDTPVSFKKVGVDLALVAFGNEIRHGMLWPLGRVDIDVQPWSALVANFSNLATLYKSARQGVEDAIDAGVRKPQVIIHIDNG